MFVNAPPLDVGDFVDGHKIVRVIGSGGMGTVYEAVHPRLQRNVALKIVRFRDRDPAEDDFRRFAREAAAMARVDDDNVVTIYDRSEWQLPNGDLVPYFTMQLVDGSALNDRLGASDFSADDALNALRGAAAGLDACHAKDVIHRDVKPHNILVPRGSGGRGLLTDFGIARISSYSTITPSPIQLGTLPFMAPEVLMGKQASRASDIFSFGCTIYFALTGHEPRDTRSWDAPVIPASAFKPELARIDEVLLRALASEPAERHHSAQGLVDELCDSLDTAQTVRQPKVSRNEWSAPLPPRRQVHPLDDEEPRGAGVRPKPAFASPPPRPRVRVELIAAAAVVVLLLAVILL